MWIHGYKVETMDDWTFEKDGKTYYYVNIEYIRHGGRISDPAWEKSYLLYPAQTAREMLQAFPDTLIEQLAQINAPNLTHIQLNPDALNVFKSLRRL